MAALAGGKKRPAAVHAELARAVKPDFVNLRCPITGSKIMPEKVTPSLSRQFKGWKIAFCCPGCPGPWDRLSDAEKAHRLQRAK